MRIACFGDIHGNLAGPEAVLRDVRAQAPDALVVLGDLTVLGPQPAEAVAVVRSLDAHVVGGNTDRAVPTAWSWTRPPDG